jgi:hypothetical protein
MRRVIMAAKHATQSKQEPTKSQPRSQDSAKLDPSAEGVPQPIPESLVQLQQEQDELGKPGRVSKAHAEFIDNDPGYSKDQLDHMREYYGLKESTADVAEV